MSGMKDLLGDTPYPLSPGFKERGSTSEDAARSMAGRARTLRDQTLETLKGRPMTADEVAAQLGETVLAIRPRLSELRAKKLIEPTGEKRLNASGKDAKVWRVAA